MSRESLQRWPVIVALILLVVGAGLVLYGVVVIWSSGTLAVGSAMRTARAPTATPQPTVTEPLLPPPPTSTPTPVPRSTGATAVERVPATEATRLGPTGTQTPARTLASGDPTTSNPSPTAAPTTGEPMGSSSPTAPLQRAESPTASRATATPAPTVALPPASAESPAGGLLGLQARIGVCGGRPALDGGLADRLGLGWYLDWGASPGAFRSAQTEYVPMIRIVDGDPQPTGQALAAAVDALPGALWLIGNEPDVKWQDNVAPERYAEVYHELYWLLKARDPSCQVAIGGVSQPTPLRLRYLEEILDRYEALYGAPMPVDVWNVHNFILREERDSWGVDIPPGMPDQAGRLREIADHDDVEIFRQQIVDFRRWMAERGQQDKPLIVTEYGILMPADYGFPPEQVERFMLDTFEFLRTASDPALGYPSDGYRLVQRWCWFSLADERYPTGNLVAADGEALTALGEAFAAYAGQVP